MVYHEIAIEPTALEDLKDLGLLERMFGFEHGRLIPFMPAKPKDKGCWKRLLYEHMKERLPVGKHKSVELRVGKLVEQATFRSRNKSRVAEGGTWCDLAVAEHGKSPFAAILCAGEPAHSGIRAFQGLHEPDETFPQCLREPVHVVDALKKPDQFLLALRPLILSAKRLTLIDPYFNPRHPEENDRRRWQRTVRKLGEFLREAGRLTVDVSFHTSFDGTGSADDLVGGIANEICGWFPGQTSLHVSAWSQKYQGPRFHARYLLTDKAGVGLEYGTDLGPNRTDVSLLPMRLVSERLAEFDAGHPTVFELEATCDRAGTRG